MGRELHRVPLDFDWPLRKVWKGFANPHFRPCPEAAKNNCHGGNTSAGRWLDAIVHLISLVGREGYQNTPEMHARWAKTGRTYPHPWLQEWGMAPRTKIPHDVDKKLCAIEDQRERFAALDQYRRRHPAQLLTLDSEIAALVSGLAKGRNLGPLAGGETSYAIYRTLVEAAGITDERWGVCKVCDGHGIDPAVREAYENWEREPPPTGEGWQLWETESSRCRRELLAVIIRRDSPLCQTSRNCTNCRPPHQPRLDAESANLIERPLRALDEGIERLIDANTCREQWIAGTHLNAHSAPVHQAEVDDRLGTVQQIAALHDRVLRPRSRPLPHRHGDRLAVE